MKKKQQILRDYENCYKKRLLKNVKAFDCEWLVQTRRKFHASGEAKKYSGLTTITRVDLSSEFFNELKGIQKKIKSALAKKGMGDVFAFLEPESFHMTISDIEPSSDFYVDSTDVTEAVSKKRKQEVREGFEAIGKPGRIKVQVESLGLKSTITLLAKFPSVKHLAKVQKMEEIIRAKTGVVLRDFCGHISLAYFIKQPQDFRKLLKILKQVEKSMGVLEYEFDEIELAYFYDMDNYIPMLIKHLGTGSIYAACPLKHLPT